MWCGSKVLRDLQTAYTTSVCSISFFAMTLDWPRNAVGMYLGILPDILHFCT